MEQGQFYFISDGFYELYDKGHTLMRNKETIVGAENRRPCFFAFRDSKSPRVF